MGDRQTEKDRQTDRYQTAWERKGNSVKENTLCLLGFEIEIDDQRQGEKEKERENRERPKIERQERERKRERERGRDIKIERERERERREREREHENIAAQCHYICTLFTMGSGHNAIRIK